MSVNWRQSEICIAIYEKPQGSTAKHLSWDALLHYNLSFNLLAKEFLKSANIWQRRTRRTSCCSAESKRPHRCCHTPIKVENIDGTPDIPCTLQLVGRCPPLKLPIPLGDSGGAHLICGCSCHRVSIAQTAHRSVQPFLSGPRL